MRRTSSAAAAEGGDPDAEDTDGHDGGRGRRRGRGTAAQDGGPNVENVVSRDGGRAVWMASAAATLGRVRDAEDVGSHDEV